MDRRGIDYEIFFTTGTGDAMTKAHELTKDAGSADGPIDIITIGGDGTVNEVLNGICIRDNVTLGYIPSGTGNDFARSMHLGQNPQRIMGRFVRGRRIEALDYGVLTCESGELVRRFINSSGAGYDAAVCHQLENYRETKSVSLKKPGKIGYILEGARQFLLFKPSRGYIILDSDRRVEFNDILFISCHIHPYEGGGFKFGTYADPKDGMLELCVVSGRNKLRLIPVLAGGKVMGLHQGRGVHFYQCREAHIHLDRGLPVHTDGECVRYQTEMDVRCVQQQLRILR